MYPELKSLIHDLLQITAEAGRAIVDIYQNETDFGIEHKADDSPLTRADRAANDIICRRLEKLPLPYPIISEENKESPYEVRKTWHRCWLVDPLDGTKEFIKRNGDFTVNIALIENHRAILGVVGIPAAGEIYWALQGHGAFLVKNGQQTPISASQFEATQPGLNIVCSRSHLNEETNAFLKKYNSPNIVSRGSALKFLLLATGEAHLYPRIAPTMEWDTAAAQVVLEEAGGKVLVYGTDRPLRYNRENMLNPSFIAMGREV